MGVIFKVASPNLSTTKKLSVGFKLAKSYGCVTENPTIVPLGTFVVFNVIVNSSPSSISDLEEINS